MQIVIKVDDDYYFEIKNAKVQGDTLLTLEQSVMNGTPLDKIRSDIENHIDKEKLRFGGQFDSGLNQALKIIDSYIEGEET